MLLAFVASLLMLQPPVAAVGFGLPSFKMSHKARKNVIWGTKHLAMHAFILFAIQAAQIAVTAYAGQESRGVDTRTKFEKIKEAFLTLGSKHAWTEHASNVKSIFRPQQARDPLAGSIVALGGKALALGEYKVWTALMSTWLAASSIYYPAQAHLTAKKRAQIKLKVQVAQQERAFLEQHEASPAGVVTVTITAKKPAQITRNVTVAQQERALLEQHEASRAGVVTVTNRKDVERAMFGTGGTTPTIDPMTRQRLKKKHKKRLVVAAAAPNVVDDAAAREARERAAKAADVMTAQLIAEEEAANAQKAQASRVAAGTQGGKKRGGR